MNKYISIDSIKVWYINNEIIFEIGICKQCVRYEIINDKIKYMIGGNNNYCSVDINNYQVFKTKEELNKYIDKIKKFYSNHIKKPEQVNTTFYIKNIFRKPFLSEIIKATI